jgi:hypothetical protein
MGESRNGVSQWGRPPHVSPHAHAVEHVRTGFGRSERKEIETTIATCQTVKQGKLAVPQKMDAVNRNKIKEYSGEGTEV